KEDESGSLSVVFGEIRGFGLELGKNRFDGLVQSAVDHGGISVLDGDGTFSKQRIDLPPRSKVYSASSADSKPQKGDDGQKAWVKNVVHAKERFTICRLQWCQNW